MLLLNLLVVVCGNPILPDVIDRHYVKRCHLVLDYPWPQSSNAIQKYGGSYMERRVWS